MKTSLQKTASKLPGFEQLTAAEKRFVKQHHQGPDLKKRLRAGGILLRGYRKAEAVAAMRKHES